MSLSLGPWDLGPSQALDSSDLMPFGKAIRTGLRKVWLVNCHDQGCPLASIQTCTWVHGHLHTLMDTHAHVHAQIPAIPSTAEMLGLETIRDSPPPPGHVLIDLYTREKQG